MQGPTAADVFAALGDPIRLRLLERLCEQAPLTVTSLAEDFDVTRQAISKHLRVLELAGLARNRRVGRESRWQLERSRLQEARRHFDALSKRWDEALERLSQMLAAETRSG